MGEKAADRTADRSDRAAAGKSAERGRKKQDANQRWAKHHAADFDNCAPGFV